MTVRLLACDLDGTLVGPGDTGLSAAKQVVDYCRARGVSFTLATGRVFGAVERYLRHLGVGEPVITNGGALIASLDKDPIMQKTIDPAAARHIAAYLRSFALPFYLIAGKDMYTEWSGPETGRYSENIAYQIEVVRSLDTMGVAPTQVVVRVPPESAGAHVARFKERFPKNAVVLSLPHLIEVQAEGVSKASALEYLAREIGVAREEVLAVGDSLNDLDMLAWAGRSACVGNARPEVAAAVGQVASLPYSEGVMEIVKKAL